MAWQAKTSRLTKRTCAKPTPMFLDERVSQIDSLTKKAAAFFNRARSLFLQPSILTPELLQLFVQVFVVNHTTCITCLLIMGLTYPDMQRFDVHTQLASQLGNRLNGLHR